MRPPKDPRFSALSETTRARCQVILVEPLPERWVDLTNALKAKEQAARELNAATPSPDIKQSDDQP